MERCWRSDPSLRSTRSSAIDALEHYKLPRSIRRDRQRLKIYLDTAYKPATEDFCQKVIVPALERLRSIIVIATPGAYEARAEGERNWIERMAMDLKGNEAVTFQAAEPI
jgi:hypothetical protein